ncbi:hypothetical protein L218DRAFT_1003870 [Marasmius fiardii PR-910]|nr:hypothetical protein L218DRAFT_1003870 [Marasmius fiardii PR-910]
MSQNLTRAQELKEAANALFVKKGYEAAGSKYTEALSLNLNDRDFNAVLYANRSACRLHQRRTGFQNVSVGRFLDVATDANHATELDPLYAKAWARLATAKDMLKQLRESKNAWQKALDALQHPDGSDLNASELKQKEEYERGLASALKALEEADTHGDAPWNLALRLIPQPQREQNFESSAWAMAAAYTDFEEGNKNMSRLKMDGERVEFYMALEPLTNAIMTDSRVFHLTTSEWISQLNKQLNAEMIGFGGWRDAEPLQIISEAKERLEKEGWDKVRPALSVTIRAFILFAFAGGRLLSNHTAEVQYLDRATDIIEHGQKEWNMSDPRLVVPSFGRRSNVAWIKCIWTHSGILQKLSSIQLYGSEADPSVREQILDESLDKTIATLDNVTSSPPPPRGVDPAFVSAFYYHARGHAYAMVLQQERERALSEDDQWHLTYLTIAVENMVEGATAGVEVFKALKRIRSAIPKAEIIWGGLMSKAGLQERFQRVLSFEPRLRQLLDEGKIAEDSCGWECSSGMQRLRWI